MTTGKAVNVVARKDMAENTEKEVDVECLKGLDEDPGKVSAMLVERKILSKIFQIEQSTELMLQENPYLAKL